ncbi:nitroreductase/quinone reductase family protein [Planobispora siamensis]|uniref:Deazaflavin-dependent oxidoreductase, nitroreductase family n=1 Tax=Planobispora siamensis TaxID=936338 RepID=A0A8J3WNX9_9ACTN|nr:nitroreductase/quinone reductase family protein [Planobispora siamensis]GIH96305.1 hypothetical protein Psi01_69350 [Planobispora siamensis]
MTRAAAPSARRPRRVLDRVQTRLVNPVVRRLLGTPWHDLVSRWVVLLTLTGRRSGAAITVPVQYAQDGDVLTLVSRRSRNWWRNLEGGAALRLVLRGAGRTGRAVVSRDPERVRAALSAVGRTVGREGNLMPVEEAVAVTVRLDPLDPADAPRPWPADRRWLRRWIVAVTAGEILGFSVPALTGPAVADPGWAVLGVAPLLQAAAILMAGLVEGTVLGLAQAYALRTALPSVGTGSWVRATAAGAAVAWAIGAVPIVLGEGITKWPVAVVVLLGLVLLAAMGLFQWRVLRRRVAGAAWWIAASAGAWLVALGVFFAVASPLWQEGQPGWLTAVIGLFGGLLMAATAAVLTGLAMRRLLRRPVAGR